MERDTQPIGYWLKLLDRRIDAAFDRVLADEGLHRRHWQTLQVLETEPHSASDLTDALAPFFGDGTETAEQVLADLSARGWAKYGASHACVLTTAGKDASARLGERIRLLRQQTVAGVSQADYRAALVVLERMANNLAQAAA
jgi:hypothetical protein